MLMSGFENVRGKVSVAQSLGAGAFLNKPVTLARLGASIRQEFDAARDGHAASHRDVLIVDDEEPIRQLFKMIISAEIPAVKVDVAENGQTAVEVFASGRHSVIVMDLYMPVKDGRQAFGDIESLCRKNKWAMPSVIFCTGFALPESLKRIIDNGRVHCLLRKPVRTDALVHAVKERLVQPCV
jgi:two-component system, sensor histidine kinase and response regulator